MELLHFLTCVQLVVLTIIVNAMTYGSAKPQYSSNNNYMESVRSHDRFSDDYYYGAHAGHPLSDYRINRLRHGYYYIDGGYITAVHSSEVPAAAALPLSTLNRRQDSIAETATIVRYNPLLKYKQTHTKRKKLFVPNLFG